MAAPVKPNEDYGSMMYGFTDFVHVPAKKTHYDAWSSSTSGCSSSSSPNHLDELHVDIPHSSTASVASASTTSHHSAAQPTFADLKPLTPKVSVAADVLALASDPAAVPTTALPAEVPQLSAYPNPTQTGYRAAAPVVDTVATAAPKVIRPQPIHPAEEGPQITHDARFSSFSEFEEAFEAWKKKWMHPFRVASSETLREPDGTVNHRFKYRYVVFHCAHYGEPRMRGIGKRPNQHYLPSGCRAMLRLNYSFAEQLLKITTLHDEHLNHEISAEMFRKVSAKLKRSSIGASSPASKRMKTESPVPSSQYAPQDTSLCQPPPLVANSPLQANTPTSAANSLSAQISLSQSSQMASMAIALQQQQIMASLLSQQKENINLNPNMSNIGIARPQPSMMNILGMMGLHQRILLQQPAYGLVAPLTQQVSSPPQAQSVPKADSNPQKENESKVAPAPSATKPNPGSAPQQQDGSPRGSPPKLMAEAPLAAEQQTYTPSTPSSTSTLASFMSFEESLARLRNGTQDAELMARIAQLNSLPFWGAPAIPEFR